MKSFINRIKLVSLTLLAAVGLILSSQAYSITNFTLAIGAGVPGGGRTNLLFSAPVNISYIKVTTLGLPTGTNAVLNFYDSANSNSISYTNIAYTNYATVKTNLTSISTNSFGNLQTNTYPGQWTYETAVAAATNTLPVLVNFNQGANTSYTVTQNIVTGNGLVVNATTLVTNVVVEVGYSFGP